MGLTSNELNKGGIMPLKRVKYGSHKSRIADIGCLSQSMLGNQLSKTLISKTQLYISSHLANPVAVTAIGAPVDLLLSLIAAKNSGPTAVERVSVFGRIGAHLRERREISEARSLGSERAMAQRVVIVLVDPWSRD